MKQEDLAHFAVSDGLLEQVAQQRTSGLTDAERMYLLDRARENLARAADVTLETAGRELHRAAAEGEFTLQASDQFAVVSAWGRVLTVYARCELRGACHPDSN